jgi:hypothetical protein
MSEFLVWPDAPKLRCKRQIERQQFAIISRKYQEMFEKHHAKAAEKYEKQGMRTNVKKQNKKA